MTRLVTIIFNNFSSLASLATAPPSKEACEIGGCTSGCRPRAAATFAWWMCSMSKHWLVIAIADSRRRRGQQRGGGWGEGRRHRQREKRRQANLSWCASENWRQFANQTTQSVCRVEAQDSPTQSRRGGLAQLAKTGRARPGWARLEWARLGSARQLNWRQHLGGQHRVEPN